MRCVRYPLNASPQKAAVGELVKFQFEMTVASWEGSERKRSWRC